MQISVFLFRLNCLNTYARLAFRSSLSSYRNIPTINPQNTLETIQFGGDFVQSGSRQELQPFGTNLNPFKMTGVSLNENLASYSISFYSVNSHQFRGLKGESMVKDNEFTRENFASIGREKEMCANQMDHEGKVLAQCFPAYHSSLSLISWIWRLSLHMP